MTPDGAAAARIAPTLLAWLGSGLVRIGLAALGALGAIAIAWHARDLFLLDEVGYGDSYILYDVLHVQRTGLVYRDLSQPPFLAAQYSPLVYLLFAATNLLVGPQNPFIGPRVLVFAAFLCCTGIAVWLTQTMLERQWSWAWGALAVASIRPLADWVLQIRADFLGIGCSLLAMRLLLHGSHGTAIAAGLCAGLALQFKITFVAVGAAGVVWLGARRQWRRLLAFSVTAAATSVGGYLLYSLREPGMFAQLFALSPGVPEPRGVLRLLTRAAGEPVFLLAIVGLPAVLGRDPRWWLLALYAGGAWMIALVTSVQAGANINYYFEPLLALIPFAVAGLFVVARHAREAPGIGLLLALLATQFLLLPRTLAFYRDVQATPSVAQRNEAFTRVADVLRRYRVLSTVPRIALLDPSPPLMEPYLLSYLAVMGRTDARPILALVRDRRVDAVITSPTRRAYRGIPLIEPELGRAIATHYEPRCTLPDLLVHTPRVAGTATNRLARELEGIGCAPVTGPIDAVP